MEFARNLKELCSDSSQEAIEKFIETNEEFLKENFYHFDVYISKGMLSIESFDTIRVIFLKKHFHDHEFLKKCLKIEASDEEWDEFVSFIVENDSNTIYSCCFCLSYDERPFPKFTRNPNFFEIILNFIEASKLVN